MIQNEACEINVAEHCNLRCRGCSHMSPVLPKAFVTPDDVYRDLRMLAPHYQVEHVRLLGGEPLLHPDLPAVVSAVRESGVTSRVRILTNGTLLSRAPLTVWRSVDEIHVSMYPTHEASSAELRVWASKAAETGVDLTVKRFDYFRESYTEMRNEKSGLVHDIYSSCQIAHVWRCHNVSNGYFFKCPQSIYINRLLGRSPGTDGIRIDDTNEFVYRLRDYLDDPEPLRACSNCLGSVGRQYPHQQLSSREWRQQQHRPIADMLDDVYLAELQLHADRDNGCVTTTEVVSSPKDF